jgi:hypothetical protein
MPLRPALRSQASRRTTFGEAEAAAEAARRRRFREFRAQARRGGARTSIRAAVLERPAG